MPNLTAEDFPDVHSAADLDEVMSTGFGPSGEPGTAEHALNVADALSFSDGDIYFDFAEGPSSPQGFAEAAATHANISSLQVSATYAAQVMKALADNPELMEQVTLAMSAPASPKP